MSKKLLWEDPPLSKSGRHAEAFALAKMVAARPNKWARIGTYRTYSTAYQRGSKIRDGENRAWNEVGTFRMMIRQTDAEEYGLWVKCIYVKKGNSDEG